MSKDNCCSKLKCMLYGVIGALIGSLLYTFIPKALDAYHNRVVLSVKPGDIIDTLAPGTGLRGRSIVIALDKKDFTAQDREGEAGWEHFYKDGEIHCAVISSDKATFITNADGDPIMHHKLVLNEGIFLLSNDAKVIGHVDLATLYDRADADLE